MKTVAIFASNGFLGSETAKFLAKQNYKLILVNRKKISFDNAEQFIWDGKNISDWQQAIEKSDVVINFAGRSVNCRYNKKNKQEIYNSRILTTRIIGQAISKATNPPKLWINASTSTIYKESFESANTEDKGTYYTQKELKNKFSEFIAHSWEDEFNSFELKNTRKVLLRTSMIYGHNAPLFKIMRSLVLLGFGGSQYPTNQIISWMHIDDYIRACQFIIENETCKGAFNMSTANPETNKDFMKIFCKVFNKKLAFGIKSKFFLKIMAFLWRTESILVTKSRYAHPQKLLDKGFSFKFDKFLPALENINKTFNSK